MFYVKNVLSLAHSINFNLTYVLFLMLCEIVSAQRDPKVATLAQKSMKILPI